MSYRFLKSRYHLCKVFSPPCMSSSAKGGEICWRRPRDEKSSPSVAGQKVCNKHYDTR
jgi:hypothetical protein